MISKQILLAQRPVGMPTADTFTLAERELPKLTDNQLLVQVEYISLDPAMRGWMDDVKSYLPPVGIGEVMRAGGVGKVLESTDDNYVAGDYVTGLTGVADYAVIGTEQVRKVDPDLVPLERYLGTLGMPGMTAYFGMLDTGAPKAGETVVVSGAAGAVGTVAGQIAKIKGCKVVGIAGGKDKCDYLVNELGFDAAIDYKNSDLRSSLKAACPNGIDVFFDNVGGETLDTVLTLIALNARIVICGAISQYNNTEPVKGPSNYLSLIVYRAKMEGILVSDNAARYEEAAIEMAGWTAQGKLIAREHVVQGLETFPDTLAMLFTGENLGKLVIKVRGD